MLKFAYYLFLFRHGLHGKHRFSLFFFPTPLKDSAMRTELSMLNLCRMRPVFTSGDKYSENMQYKRLYFLLFVDGFGGFGKNQQRYGSHQSYSRKVIPDVMRIDAGSFPSFPGCK